MNQNIRKILLARLFLSRDYQLQFVNAYDEMVSAMEAGMRAFLAYQQEHPDIDSDNIQGWQVRGLPNIQRGAYRARQHFENGDTDGVSSSAGNLRGLSKDVDSIGGFGLWWQHIDDSYKSTFFANMKKAKRIGNNIYYTGLPSWEGDEILNENITGPINESDLLAQLRQGETIDNVKE